MNKTNHIPVMLAEALTALAVKPKNWYLDATFGQGGHTQEILKLGGQVLALDYDQRNVLAGNEKFTSQIKTNSLILIRENFAKLQSIVTNLNLKIQGILFDFGTTSEQLMSTDLGLSFESQNSELDMRLDDRLGVKAKDLLAILGKKQLQKIFEVFGGEREAKKIARQLIAKRREGEFITTTQQLAELIKTIKAHNPSHLHPATKVFQALRIAVNDELTNIGVALPQALDILQPRGKIITIAFHEGEDRIIKNLHRTWSQQNLGHSTHKKVLKPSEAEILKNSRSRSAKMRIFEKK